MYCRNCGCENRDGAKFCVKCGATLTRGSKAHTDPSQGTRRTKNSKSPVRVIIALLITMLFITAAAYMVYRVAVRNLLISELDSRWQTEQLDQNEAKSRHEWSGLETVEYDYER